MVPMALKGRLDLPAIASPLLLISSPDLVVETCRAGVIGSFSRFNQRTPEGYRGWLKEIRTRLDGTAKPWAAQFVIHHSNERHAADMALTVEYQVPILIIAIGITREVTSAIHAYGGLVFHNAINMRYSKRALEANVDGIIAVCNGAGGHAGTYNPFAFIGELVARLERQFHAAGNLLSHIASPLGRVAA